MKKMTVVSDERVARIDEARSTLANRGWIEGSVTVCANPRNGGIHFRRGTDVFTLNVYNMDRLPE